MVKKTKEAWKTYQGVFDGFINRDLFELSSKGHFIELKSPISIGKESHIFSASTKSGERVIVKIHRLETCDFNKMYDYIRSDPRYLWLKKHKRKIIFAWTQREFRNLMKAREAGVSIPKPIVIKDNILIMEFIGDDDVAPKLKDYPPENPKKFLEMVISNMKKLYQAGLVHGDLSSFNILNYNEKPVFIDFSQAMPVSTQNAKELLDKDVHNIATFFTKHGAKITSEELKKQVTGK
ncbi:MAG: serine protein kinase RIO [Candidatus Woesearchaeota archaeon]